MKKPIAVRSLYGHVMHEIGLRIVSGKVKPGEILPREETLAESLQVSRTALREALKVLSAKGLIESRTGVGARVLEERYWNQLDADVLAWRCASMPTDDFVDKLVEMREIIEPAAAAAAAAAAGSMISRISTSLSTKSSVGMEAQRQASTSASSWFQ